MPPSATEREVSDKSSVTWIDLKWADVSDLQPKRDLLPPIAIAGYTRDFKVPTMSEGFSEIKTINWVFEGDAEAKRRWSMWLQLDGAWAFFWLGINAEGFSADKIMKN